MFRRACQGIVAISLPLVVLVAAAPHNANATPTVHALIRQAEVQGLALDPYWLALVHYRKSAGGFVSDALPGEFFLSPSGPTDPSAELSATLEALFAPLGRDPDQHAKCRFPARYRWLRRTLNWGVDAEPFVACEGFRQWSMEGTIESLSVVFATGYLGNPASFYGHILLKFDSSSGSRNSDLLDKSLNYGAVVPEHENGLVYIAKGLFGGYEAGFSHSTFYRHNHMYAETELRDLWEYELTLTKDEIDQIVSHSWELLGVTFKYFFVTDNCAYRMAELLRLVVGSPLLPSAVPWAMPSSVFDSLASIERNGQPLVRAVRRIPSRQNRLREKYSGLTEQDRKLTVRIAKQRGAGPADEEYAALPVADRIAITDTLLEYYEFRVVSDPSDETLRAAKQQMLVERLRLPVGSSPLAQPRDESEPPHKGPRATLLRVGNVHNTGFGDAVELGFRVANYDTLSIDYGRIPHSMLTMFDTRVVYANDDVSLRRLDIVNLQTFNVSRTGLPGDGGPAWKVRLGWEDHELGCVDCQVARLEGGVGKAVAALDTNVLYGMMDLRLQTGYENSGNVAATLRGGFVVPVLPYWKLHFEAGRRKYFDGDQTETPVVSFENRFGADRDWDVRLGYQKERDEEFNLGLSWYW